ncbi:MAG: hypothetical protein J6W88_03410 [Bacteroidales bacterium]|nr:hypothetical protein [Bacteroidales bacterium]
MDNIINPPEVDLNPKRGGFWKQLGMLVLGTTVSLVLTFLAPHNSSRKANAPRTAG